MPEKETRGHWIGASDETESRVQVPSLSLHLLLVNEIGAGKILRERSVHIDLVAIFDQLVAIGLQQHEVLKGARAVLDRRSIKFIYFEFNTIERKPGTTGGALVPIDRLLQEYGYQFIASYNDYVVATGGDPFVVANALYALPPSTGRTGANPGQASD